MQATLRGLAARRGRPVADEEQFKRVTIEDSAECVLEMSSVWIDRFTHTRTTRAGGNVQEDGTTITRKTE